MNNNVTYQSERRAYPNIIMAEAHVDSAPASRSTRRCFSNKMMRAIAISEARDHKEKPSFECKSCGPRFIMTYAVFVRDNRQAFSESFYVCRDCAKKNIYSKQK